MALRKSTFARLASAVVLVGGTIVPALLTGIPASATVSNCTFGPGGPPLGPDGPILFKATCTAAPTDSWDLAITCENYSERVTAPIYGGLQEGSGTSYAKCPAINYHLYSWWIRTVSS